MDDVLVMGENKEEHDTRLDALLNKISKAGMTLNREKCSFGSMKVEFLGFKISGDGIQAGEKIQGIREFPVPDCVKAVRSFLGLINQYSRFNHEIATVSEPIRELLKKDIGWFWDRDQEISFEKLKKIFNEPHILAHFDPKKKTMITTDACNQGIGAVLSQIDSEGNRRMIGAASRSLTSAEKNYAVIEKEALGVVWGLEKFNYYICGAPIVVETDHKPLITLLGRKEVEKIPIRIQRFRIRLMRYSVEMVYIPGKLNIGADALSRYPSKTTSTSNILEIEVNQLVESTFVPGESVKLNKIRKIQEDDVIIKEVISKICNGWSYKDRKNSDISKYYENTANLSMMKGCLTYQNRLVIPRIYQQVILSELHVGHQGISKYQARARECVWWFGISRDVERMVRNCRTCLMNSRTTREPMKIIPVPKKAWEIVGTDLYTFKDKKYLIIVDYYSRYIETMLLKNELSETVILSIKSIFSRHGIPETVVSDNGRQFSSKEFKEFSQSYSFQHITSSYHPSTLKEIQLQKGEFKQ